MTTAGVLASSAALTASTSAGSYPAVTVVVTDTTSNLTASRTYAVSVAFAQVTLGGPSNLGGFAPSANISASYPATGGEAPYTWSASGTADRTDAPTALNRSADGLDCPTGQLQFSDSESQIRKRTKVPPPA